MTDTLYRNYYRASNEGSREDCILSLPCFETQNREDRPLAPAAEDYPLGCEVELLDIDFAKIAQESQYWEPFMDIIFSKPRRRVKVARHLGDYTFVLCSDIDGFMQVGLTLYRACLREPKVKTTKYYSELVEHLDDEDERLGLNSIKSVLRPGDESRGHALDRPISKSTPLGQVAEDNQTKKSSRCNFNPTLFQSWVFSDGSENGGCVWQQKGLKAVKCKSPPQIQATNVVTKVDDGGASKASKRHTRSKFIMLMKQGTHAIKTLNYESAICYYNLALREAPKEAVRVLSSRSAAYLFLGKLEDSFADAERVITLAPDSYLGYVRVGNVLRSMRRFRDAQSYYRRAIKRDPTNTVIQKLFFENSIAMLFGSRIKQFSKIKIEYNQSHMRAQIVARCPVKKGGVVFKETTSLMALLGPTGGDPLSPKKAGGVCQNCGKAFLDEEAIQGCIPGLPVEVLRFLYKESKPVRCTHGCDARYCSVECRTKAWAAQHWVECHMCGRWKAGVGEAHAYLNAYLSAQPQGRGGYSSKAPLGDMSPATVGAVLRIAIRMLSCMMSCVWSLKDAVHMFDWLRVSPAVEAQREQVRSVVQGCYKLLSISFLPEERSKLTYELFERCYERAKSNAVFMCITGWSDVVFRAESLRTLLDEDPHEETRKLLPRENSTSCSTVLPFTQMSNSFLNFVKSKRSYLDEVLSIPPEGAPSTHLYVVAVFELFAMTNVVNMCPSAHGKTVDVGVESLSLTTCDLSSMKLGIPCCLPNLSIHNTIDSSVRIYARALEDVEKGDAYVSEPPTYPSGVLVTALIEN